MVAELFRQGFPHADAGDPGRAGLPGAVHAGFATFHRAAAPEGAVQAAAVPRRRALDLEAAKRGAVVQHVSRMDWRVDPPRATTGSSSGADPSFRPGALIP